MEILTFISNLMIPLVIMYIVAYGLLAKTDIFDAFLVSPAFLMYFLLF